MAWSWSLAPDTAEHANALQLTDTEMVILARMEWLCESEGNRTMREVVKTEGNVWNLDGREMEAYLSLCRMGYIVGQVPREVRHATLVDELSDHGRTRLQGIRARSYKCCSYAIRLPCVCMERTYCPVGHPAGCHGTHD